MVLAVVYLIPSLHKTHDLLPCFMCNAQGACTRATPFLFPADVDAHSDLFSTLKFVKCVVVDGEGCGFPVHHAASQHMRASVHCCGRLCDPALPYAPMSCPLFLEYGLDASLRERSAY